MSAENDGYYDDCSFVSIHYIICECGETFPSENGLKAHLEKEHPHKRERKEFKCGVCGSIFNTEEECIAHYEDAHIEELKHEVYSEEEDIKPELSQPEIALQEEEEIQEEYVENEEEHVENVEEIEENEEDSQEYHHLPEQYEEVIQDVPEGQLVLVVRDAAQKKQKKPVSRHPKDSICESCGKKYASNAALKYHQRVHTGERPYKCDICPKTFTMPLFLQIHIRTHTGERPYACPDCPKAFSNKAALLRHERVHTGEKPYTCPMCLKSFTQSNSMKLHVATVHLKQPAPYKSKTRRLKEAERQNAKIDKQPGKVTRLDKAVQYATVPLIVHKTKSGNFSLPRIVHKSERESEGAVQGRVATPKGGRACISLQNIVVRKNDVIGRIAKPKKDVERQNKLMQSLTNGLKSDYGVTIIKLESEEESGEVVESEIVNDHHDEECYEIVYES